MGKQSKVKSESCSLGLNHDLEMTKESRTILQLESNSYSTMRSLKNLISMDISHSLI